MYGSIFIWHSDVKHQLLGLSLLLIVFLSSQVEDKPNCCYSFHSITELYQHSQDSWIPFHLQELVHPLSKGVNGYIDRGSYLLNQKNFADAPSSKFLEWQDINCSDNNSLRWTSLFIMHQSIYLGISFQAINMFNNIVQL